MRTLILWMLVLTIAYNSNAQNVNIPDINFKNALISEGVDINEDGEISYAEAELITYLGVAYYNISDMTGIEAFVNLDTLGCSGNQLTSLDVSGCAALTELWSNDNQLTSLNVSNNAALKHLHCYKNDLIKLDISNNTALTELICNENQLTSLNVSHCADLTTLLCSYNQLTSLDISGCAALTELWCNDNQLSSLNISDCTDLVKLNCIKNQITSLNVSGYITLTELWCFLNQLTRLDVSGCTALTTLLCSENQLTSLDVSNNLALKNLWLSNMPNLYEICVWELPFPPAGVNVDTAGSPNVYFTTNCKYVDNAFIPDTAFLYALIDEGVDTNGDSLISYVEAEMITYLDVNEKNITDITGIEAFVNLDTLYCDNNQLTSLDVTNNAALKRLHCQLNQLTSLNVFSNAALTELWCNNNQLTSLDVSGCTALKRLSCMANLLTSLDVSGCNDLTELDCSPNLLTSLDVSDCTALVSLGCTANQLTRLDISNNTALKWLWISHMPTLYEVCVWEEPFPPASVDDVDTTGSPNVFFTTECSTNVKGDYKENRTIYIYPNPSDDIINIEIENIDNATIDIYNVSGRLILSKALNLKQEKINISELSEGMYFVKVRQENNVRIEKLIVY